jgi:hypothetical protein
MATLDAATWRAAVVGRWIARIAGTLMALFFLAFLVGEGPPPVFRLSWRESLEFAGMAGLVFGMLAAWKWERVGGLVTLAGFGVLCAMNRRFFASSILLIPAMVGVVHVLCGWRIASGAPASGIPWRVPRTALWIAGGVAGVFILLCANEMFGNPPLMTPALRPSPEMVGRWQGELTDPVPVKVEFLISPDGAVTVRMGETDYTGGRICNNRSWFGNLMNWRDPYEIGGGGVSADVAMHGRGMRAFICLYAGSRRGWGLTLRKQ